jgi:hypothetical protein
MFPMKIIPPQNTRSHCRQREKQIDHPPGIKYTAGKIRQIIYQQIAIQRYGSKVSPEIHQVRNKQTV